MLPPGTLEAFGLYLARTSALVLGAPLFGTGARFTGYKVGLIGVLSVVLFLAGGAPATEAAGPVEYGILVLREVFVGLTLAVALHVVLLAVRVGSELVGHEMAFTISRVVDPTTGTNVPVVAHLYEVFFLLTLLATNGHHWVIRALSESYSRAPVGVMSFDDELSAVALTQFADLFAAGVTFAAPILVLLLTLSLIIALLTRAVPQINILEFGFTLRILGGLAAMFLFAPALTPAMDRLLVRLMDGLSLTLETLGA